MNGIGRFALGAVIWGSVALAQTTPVDPTLMDLEHARNFAMGGAYRSLGYGTEAIDGNPASITLFKHYLIEASGSWDYQSKDTWGSVSILDSSSGPVGAGVSYHLVSIGRGDDHVLAHVNTLALAYPLSESLHIGVSAKHILMTGATSGNAITMDAGVLVHLTDSIVVSVTGNNLIDIENPFIHRYYTASAGFLAGVFTLAADVRGELGAPDPGFAYSAGAEYIFGQLLPLRAGYQYNSATHSHFVSGGLGFSTEGGGLDVSYRHEIGGSEGRLFAITLRLQVS